ncbi:hypothetical protein [Nocardioides sp. zg-DK7169]|uniref:hypothetical protein n=1 Tax=Nocardioides sp. zg-DK7169 TaxID=2736600 RepID=UPI00155563FA|nr:hypothetical protein [Nocardioides sp. zg-DK7169]
MTGPHDAPHEQDPARPDAAEHPDGIGSVTEEAAKLFGALAGLAREHGFGDHPAGGHEAAGSAGSAEDTHPEHGEPREPGEHTEHAEHAGHTGGPECTWCPVCRAVHLVRQTSPEVRTHLASAVSSLAKAAAGLLATTVPDAARTPRPGVDHIDIDLDDDLGDPDGGPDRGGAQ